MIWAKLTGDEWQAFVETAGDVGLSVGDVHALLEAIVHNRETKENNGKEELRFVITGKRDARRSPVLSLFNSTWASN